MLHYLVAIDAREKAVFFGHFMLDYVVLGQDMLYRCFVSSSIKPE